MARPLSASALHTLSRLARNKDAVLRTLFTEEKGEFAAAVQWSNYNPTLDTVWRPTFRLLLREGYIEKANEYAVGDDLQRREYRITEKGIKAIAPYPMYRA